MYLSEWLEDIYYSSVGFWAGHYGLMVMEKYRFKKLEKKEIYYTIFCMKDYTS